MRLAALITTAALAVSATAVAAPLGPVAEVRVAIGPELTSKADDYGAREFDYLARDLRNAVEARLGRVGVLAPAGGVLELTIVDVKPNRPTLEQLSETPGLSMDSLAIGGAEVAGRYVSPDGAHVPVGYRWYENDIGEVRAASTWSDATRAFDRFADRLARGELTR